MGIIAGPVNDADLLEIPLYRERFLAYVSEGNPDYSSESIPAGSLLNQPIWIIRDGLRQLSPSEMSASDFTYDRYFEGGRVGILIQVVNESGGVTIVPEMHRNFMTESQQQCLRPIVDPVPGRTISIVIRNDYIHEAKLNAVTDAVRDILPATLLEPAIRKGHLRI